MNKANYYWESYLVRFLVPTIVTALCLMFLTMSGQFEVFGIINASNAGTSTKIIKFFKDNFDATTWIVFGIVCFAIQYLVSSISLLIFGFRNVIYNWFAGGCTQFLMWFLFFVIYILLF